MSEINVLKGLMASRKLTQQQLKDALKLNIKTVNKKVNNFKDWTIGEAIKLKELTGVSNIEDLFFEHDIT